MNESAIKRSVMRMIKKDFPKAFVYKASDKFTAGIPDILMCINGRFVAIELKVPGNKPSKIQEYTLKKIQEAKGFTAVCNSANEVKEALMFLKNWSE